MATKHLTCGTLLIAMALMLGCARAEAPPVATEEEGVEAAPALGSAEDAATEPAAEQKAPALAAAAERREPAEAERAANAKPEAVGWLHWRGPQQDGTSLETDLPDTWELGGEHDLWQVELKGRGTPVIADGRLFAWGYRGENQDLREVLAAIDPDTGETIWEYEYNDFLSDSIYDRNAIGAPTVDPETGQVYLLTTAGRLLCFTADGEEVWEQSMMEQFGRNTYPNGRTGAPAVDGDLVIVNVISNNWGGEAPPRNRFYAFDKRNGDPVWSSTPGLGPPYLKDSSFSSPHFAWDHEGRRVFYSGIGSGGVVCINARTGEPIWRFQVSVGGLNSSVLVHEDKVIAVHGVENLDSSATGRMFAIDRTAEPTIGEQNLPVLDSDAEVWRNGIEAFSSSPVLVDDRAYITDHTGHLNCVDVETGEVLWRERLGSSQIHASPLWADGKLYVPMNDGRFHIIRPHDEGPETLSVTQLDGNCLGAPAVWNGKVYVFTTERLYAFGREGDADSLPEVRMAEAPPVEVGEPVALQAIPSEVLLRPGQAQKFRVRALDERGHAVRWLDEDELEWETFIPPTALVRAEMDAAFQDGQLVAGEESSAGAFRVTAGDLSGTIRGRVIPDIPFEQDFDDFELTEHHEGDAEPFAPPPLEWITGRMRWDIRERDGTHVLAKTLDSLILQRAMSFIGHPDMRDYTLTADVMTEGSRRLLSDVGVINQRYLIVLKGNHGELEITSNHDRFNATVPFDVRVGTWYTMKTRVDRNDDGTGVVRVKVWERDSEEPDDWTLEAPHAHPHEQGSPGLYGFAPQIQHRVYIDNIRVTPGE